MARLIDVDELLKGRHDHEMISTHLIFNAPTVNAVVIPDNATNGDMIKVLFPRNFETLKDMLDFFDHTWRNKPYERGGKDV